MKQPLFLSACMLTLALSVPASALAADAPATGSAARDATSSVSKTAKSAQDAASSANKAARDAKNTISSMGDSSGTASNTGSSGNQAANFPDMNAQDCNNLSSRREDYSNNEFDARQRYCLEQNLGNISRTPGAETSSSTSMNENLTTSPRAARSGTSSTGMGPGKGSTEGTTGRNSAERMTNTRSGGSEQ